MSGQPDTSTNAQSGPSTAWWPSLLAGLYLLTLAVGVIGEVFDIPSVLRFFLYR